MLGLWCLGTGASRSWERMTHSKEPMAPALEWAAHSEEPMARSLEWMSHSKERMTHSKERMTRSDAQRHPSAAPISA